MRTRIAHQTSFLLVLALFAALAPVGLPGAAAADVGAAGITSATLTAVSFTSTTTGFAAASNGQIFKTTNGGTSWTQVRAADSYSFVGIDFWDGGTNGVAVDAVGKVAQTTNGGSTWTNVDFTPWADMDQYLTLGHGKVVCLPGTTGDAVAAAGDPEPSDDRYIGAIPLRTTGTLSYWGNLTTLEQTPHYGPDEFGNPSWGGRSLLLDVDFFDANNGWAVGVDDWPLDANNKDKFPVYTSTDGGWTWTARGFGSTHVRFEGVSLGSATTGVAVGTLVADGSPRVYRSANGGQSWTASAALPTTKALRAVAMTDATRGWAVGDGGTIIRTTDGGATWTACTSPTSASLYDVEFIRGTTTGWAVGASGTVVKTTDGATWAVVGNGIPPDTTAPPAPTGVTATALSPASIKVSWTAVSDPSGIKHYTVTNKTTGASYTVPTGTSYTVTGLLGNTSYTFYVTATDKADNTSVKSVEKTAKTPVAVVGIAGANRIETAVLASRKAFPAGAPAVVVATAYNWPDALGGSALAGAYGGPILLTAKDALPQAVADEVVRLKATKVFVLGSAASVSDAVAKALDALPNVSVERIGGADRYETARLVAAKAVAKMKARGAWTGTAFAATGAKFPDALGASPLAARNGWPVFLVDPRAGADRALLDAVAASGATRVVVLGSTAAVSDAAKAKIDALPGVATVRVFGADRYETAAKVAAWGVSNAGLAFERVAVATGENFPDALAGGVLQGADGSVLLLTPTKTLAPAAASALAANKAAVHEVRFLGGTTAVSDAVRAAVLAALK